MLSEADIDARAERVRLALHDAYGVRGKSLARALAQAGRRLPGACRAAGAEIVAAQANIRHPKLMRRVDARGLAAAETRLLQHLDAIDHRTARTDRLLGIAASIAFSLLVVAGAFAAWLVMSGKL